MEPTLDIMTDAVIVKAVAENLLVTLDERAFGSRTISANPSSPGNAICT
jgi:hypothetical protein